MADKEIYNGSVPLPSGLKTYNERDYPLVDAHYVWVQDGDDPNLGIRLDEKIENLGASDELKEEVNTIVTNRIAPLEERVGVNENNISFNTQNITELKTDVSNLKNAFENIDFSEIGRDHRVFYDEAQQLLYLYLAKDETEENSLEAVKLAIEEDRILAETTIKGGGGGSADIDTARVKLTPISSQNQTVVLGDLAEFKFNFENIKSDDTLDMLNGSLKVTVNGEIINKETRTISPGENSVILTDYLKAGNNNIVITVVNTDNRSGRLTATFNAIDLRITSPFNGNAKYKANEPVNINYVIYGNISKTVHLKVDGNLVAEDKDIIGSNLNRSMIIPRQTHGDHTVELWATATVNGKEISSNVLFYDPMFIDENNPKVIISCDYDGRELEQYSTYTFNYSVYTPGSEFSNIVISVNEKELVNAEVDQTPQKWSYKPMSTDDIIIQFKSGDTIKEYTIKVKPFPYDVSPVDNPAFDFEPIGKTNEDIENRDKYEYNGYKMLVSDSFDWYNGGWKIDKDGSPYLLIKAGDRVSFNYPLFGNDATKLGKNFKMIFQTQNCKNFASEIVNCYVENQIVEEDKVSTQSVGIKVDSQKARMYYGSNSIDTLYAEDQLTELEFNIEPENANQEIIVYQASDPVRIKIYDSSVRFHQSTIAPAQGNQSVTFGSDDCDLRLYRFKVYERSLSMDETLKNYFADSLNADEMSKRFLRNDFMDTATGTEIDREKLAALYPNLRILLIKCPYFTKDKSNKVPGCEVTHIMGNGLREHNWTCSNVEIKGQGTSSNAYGTSARNIDMNFKNSEFISTVDQKPIELIPIVDDDGKLTGEYKPIKKYGMTENSVPVNYFNVKVNVASSENANNAVLADDYNNFQPYWRPTRLADPRIRDCMEFHPCVIFVQETDPSQANQFEVDGKYHFYACGDMGNSKKNAEAMGMLLETPGFENIENADQECIIEVSNNTSPQCRFKKATEGNFIGGILPIEYGTDGTIASKSFWDGQVMEFRYPDVDDLLDSTTSGKVYSKARSKIKQKIIDTLSVSDEDAEVLLSSEKWTGEVTKEVSSQIDKNRKRVKGMVDKFTEMWNWVNSTDTTQATNARLNPAVTYNNGKTYTSDTVEYRKAKFLYEYQDYFVRDSILYHYLFTERHTMVDNRAKNTFIHYNVSGKQAGKWDYVFNYDNDTADGNDNSGGLSFTYGMEDIDRLPSGESIFNASDSVLWVNVRNILGQDLETLAGSTVNVSDEKSINIGEAWDTSRIVKKFNDYQWEKPERLEQMDMWRKYIRPHEGYYVPNPPENMENPIKGDYLNMMYGRKTSQRLQYETYQGPYIGTKYSLGSVKAAMIRFRVRTGDFYETSPIDIPKGITITPFADMYATVDYDNAYVKKRAKAGVPILLEAPSGLQSLQDKNVQFFAPALISSLGDLAPLFIGTNDFTSGQRLLELVIGSNITGYKNIGMGQLTLKNNALLSKLDLRNVEIKAEDSRTIDVTGCVNLKEIYTTGSNINGVIFANGSLTEIAELNSISSLVVRNLIYLKTFTVPSYTNLTSLVYENCSDAINLAVLLEQAVNLGAIRLLDIDLSFSNTSILNRLAKINGIENNNSTILNNEPIITGKVHVGTIRESEIILYKKLWPDLHVTHDIVQPQGTVIFYNDDDNHTELCRIEVDYGSAIPDPIATGLISTPTKESTEKYSYSYIGWNQSLNVGPDETHHEIHITAVYQKELRRYTINWYNDEQKFSNKIIIDSQEITYGNEAIYNGKTGIPTKLDAEGGGISYLFNGWDKSTGYITGDLNVYPVWQEGSTPPQKPSETNKLTPAQLKNFVNKGFPEEDLGKFFDTALSTVSFDFGYMPSYKDPNHTNPDDYDKGYVKEEIIVDKNNPLILTGSNNRDTGIKLLAEDKSWVLALDMTFEYKNSFSCILSCGNHLSSIGLWISRSSNQYPEIHWQNSGATKLPRIPQNYTNENSRKTLKYSPREIVVLRHKKEDNNLYVYINNRETLDLPAAKAQDASTFENDYNLILGSDNFNNNKAIGKINYAKIWWDDLGDAECKKIASWIYDTIEMRFVGFKRYALSNNSGKTCTATFTMTDQILDVLYPGYNESINNVVGGWKYSPMRTYFTNKILNGVSPLWQQILAEVNVFGQKGGPNNGTPIKGKTPSGQPSTDEENRMASDAILVSSDKLYAASAYELNPNNFSNFSGEVLLSLVGSPQAQFPCFSDQSNRIAGFPLLESYPYPWFTRSVMSDSAYGVSPDGTIGTMISLTDQTEWSSFYAPLLGDSARWSFAQGKNGIMLTFSI